MTKALVLNADYQPLSYLPLSCTKWQEAIKGIFTDKFNVLYEYEDKVIRSPSITLKIPSIVILKTYLPPKNRIRFNRGNVFLRDDYICQYCGIDAKKHKVKLTLDHYIPRSQGGTTTFGNIVTACEKCNFLKSNKNNMEPIRKPFVPSYGQLVKKKKSCKLKIPDSRWIDYLDWDSELITIEEDENLIFDIEEMGTF